MKKEKEVTEPSKHMPRKYRNRSTGEEIPVQDGEEGGSWARLFPWTH